jgi:hypothetical protein
MALAPGYLVPEPRIVPPGATTARLTLSRGETLEGRVRWEGQPGPRTGAEVEVLGVPPEWLEDGDPPVSERGAFELHGLPRRGRLALRAVSPGWTSDVVELDLSSRRRDPVVLTLRPTAPPPAPVVAVAASPFRGLDGRPVRGTLSVDGSRDPGAGEGSLPPASFEVAFDASGRPDLSGLPPGRYTISFAEPAEGALRAWVRVVDTSAGPLELSFDGALERTRLEGRVLGLPAVLAEDDLVQVELRPCEPPEEAFGFLAAREVDADGGFAFPAVPPGRYDLLATWDGGQAEAHAVEVVAGRPGWAELRATP